MQDQGPNGWLFMASMLGPILVFLHVGAYIESSYVTRWRKPFRTAWVVYGIIFGPFILREWVEAILR